MVFWDTHLANFNLSYDFFAILQEMKKVRGMVRRPIIFQELMFHCQQSENYHNYPKSVHGKVAYTYMRIVSINLLYFSKMVEV